MHTSITKEQLVKFIFNNVNDEERKKIIEAISTSPEIRERYLFEKRKFDVERYIYDDINIGERCEIEELLKKDSRLYDYFALHTEAFEEEQDETTSSNNIHVTKEQIVKFILNDVYDEEYIEEYITISDAINTSPAARELYLFEKRKHDIERYLEHKMNFGERCELEELLKSDSRLQEHFELKKEHVKEQENILINLMYPPITKARLVKFVLNDVNDKERKTLIEAINKDPEVKERYLFEKRINDIERYINDEMTIGECCEIEELIKTNPRLYDYFVLNTEASEEETKEEEQVVFISDEHLGIIKEQLVNFILNGEIEGYTGEYEKINKLVNKSPVIKEVYLFEKRKNDIERYLNDEMDFGERCEIEERIKIDSRLYEHFELSKDVNKYLETTLKEKINSIHAELYDTGYNYESREIEDEASKEDTTPTIEFKLNVMKIGKWVVAASIILMLGLGGVNTYLNNRGSIESRLYASYYKPYSQMSAHLFNSSKLSEAKRLYNKGEYATALLLLDDLQEVLSVQNEKYMYSGMALIELNRHKEAIGMFAKLNPSAGNETDVHIGYWYTGLCYLKIGDTGNAIKYFKTIIANNGYKREQAKEILEKLN